MALLAQAARKLAAVATGLAAITATCAVGAESIDWGTDPHAALLQALLFEKPVVAYFSGPGPVDPQALGQVPLYDVADDAVMLVVGVDTPAGPFSAGAMERHFGIAEFPSLVILDLQEGEGPAAFEELFRCSLPANSDCAGMVTAFIKSGQGAPYGPSSSAAEPGAAKSADVCAVMDDAVAEQALAGPVQRDRNEKSVPQHGCVWRSATVAGDALTVQEDLGGPAKYDFDKERLPVQAIDGLGDAAFAFVSPAGFVQLGMVKAGTYVTIVLQLQHDPHRLDRAATLARTIAGRL